MKKWTVLLTNDDGVNAPGLIAVKQELDKVAHVHVYAPDRNWSAAGRTMTFHKPLRVDRVRLLDGAVAYACSGTPSDCVSLALLGLIEHRPDLVVSGINAGLNVGQDITYSGTVAGAMEGARGGVPAVALSQDIHSGEGSQSDYAHAAYFAARLVTKLLEEAPLPPGVLLNVNVPGSPSGSRGRALPVRGTKLGGHAYDNYLVVGKDPRGRNYYWITGDPLTEVPREEEDTDIGAVANGCISITPVHLDMTEKSLLAPLRKLETAAWFDEPATPE